jgi:hypothetical protein
MPSMTEKGKRPASSPFARVRVDRLVRSKALWGLVGGALLFVWYLRSLDGASASTSHSTTGADGRRYTSGPPFPPSSWETLRKFERELPQQDLSLPYPEGRTGRYVRFTNQVRGLGWNNVLNEL